MSEVTKQVSPMFPTYARFPITMVRGEGSLLWDDQGKEYIDLMCGVAVTNLGHNHPRVNQKLKEQMDQLWHVSNLFNIPNQQKLAELLTANSCMDAVFFCNSGAEANEAAIKIARRYFQKIRGEERYEIVTCLQSFHGRTLATLTATGQEKVREGFLPLPEGFSYVPYNDIEAIRAAIGPKTCAVMIEMVQGEGGVRPAERAYLQAVAQLCREQGILLIADEIQTGVGRTGKLFAYEHYEIEPDIMTLAKGLGNGFPIGAMLGKEFLREAFSAGSHGSTFGGTPIATAAAIGVIETILSEGLAVKAFQLGEWSKNYLRTHLDEHPLVKDIRGLGFLLGIECTESVTVWVNEMHAAGVLVIQAGPNVIRILPAITIDQPLLETALSRIVAVLQRAKEQQPVI